MSSRPRRWSHKAFDKFVDGGRKAERKAGVPRKERTFVNRKIAAACDVSVETLRKWRMPGQEPPDVDRYEMLLHYFGKPDGTWLK